LTKIKICGITEVAYAQAAVEAGADLIGVVLAPSPRQVTYEKAREIVAAVKKHYFPVVGVFVMPDWDEENLLAYLEEGQKKLGDRSPIYLLDTFVEDKYGGTGQAFAWKIARRAAAEYPAIIAGGLQPENVGEVVSSLRPWGVDVSSGVESQGVKDTAKIKAFIQAVRTAD
jgi:phosphoribosylanthranilate isomerase